MIQQYVEAVYNTFTGLLDLFTRQALPLAIVLGLAALAAGLALALQRDSAA